MQEGDKEGLLLSQGDIVKAHERQQRVNGSKNVHERTHEYHSNVKQKRQMLKEEIKVKEMEECTFAPRINKYQGEKARNLDTFIADQKKYNDKKTENSRKREVEQKEKEESTVIKSKFLNKKSEDILQKKREKEGEEEEPRYKKLYDLNKNRLQTQIQKASEAEQKETPFKPNIQEVSKQMNRGGKIDNILYQDAVRRQNKMAQAPEVKEPTQSQITGKKSKSEEYFIKRFNKEYDRAFNNLDPEGLRKIGYNQVTELLMELGFITGRQVNQNQEEPLILELWKIQEGEKMEGIEYSNLKYFLFSILGVYIPAEGDEVYDPELPVLNVKLESGDSLPPPSIYGRFNIKGQFLIEERSAKKIHKKFDLFYLNRRTILQRKKVDVPEYTFAPIVNENAGKMASKCRSKIQKKMEKDESLMGENELQGKPTLARVEMLRYQGRKVDNWREEQKAVSKEKEQKECSFKPDINNSQMTRQVPNEEVKAQYQKKHQKVSTVDNTDDRCAYLYNLSKKIKKNVNKYTLYILIYI